MVSASVSRPRLQPPPPPLTSTTSTTTHHQLQIAQCPSTVFKSFPTEEEARSFLTNVDAFGYRACEDTPGDRKRRHAGHDDDDSSDEIRLSMARCRCDPPSSDTRRLLHHSYDDCSHQSTMTARSSAAQHSSIASTFVSYVTDGSCAHANRSDGE